MKARDITAYCAISLGAAILLTGCLDVTTEITLQDDSSGELRLHYEIPADHFYMGVFDRESSYVPIPVTRADFERTAAAVDGATLRSYSRSEGDDTVTIDGRLGFDSIGTLNRLYGSDGGDIRIERDGNGTRYSQPLFPETGAISEQSRAFFEAYGSGHELRFIVDAPSTISESNTGSVDSGGERATVTLPMAELAQYRESVVWELVW